MKLIPYQFDEPTVAMLLRGLDRLPHGEVRSTYDSIVNQARKVLAEPDPVPLAPLAPASPPARKRK